VIVKKDKCCGQNNCYNDASIITVKVTSLSTFPCEPTSPGFIFKNTEAEPAIAVGYNPKNSDNTIFVVCYQQDPYTRGGGCSADYMKISFDGGDTFEAPIALPNVLCFGGPYRRRSQPRVSLTRKGEILFTGVLFDINSDGTQCKIGVSIAKYSVIS